MTDTQIQDGVVDPVAESNNGREPTVRDVAVYTLRGALDGALRAHEAVDALLTAASQRVQRDTDLQRRLRELEEWRAGVQDTRATEDVVFWRTRALKVERQNAALRREAGTREAELRRVAAMVDELKGRLAQFPGQITEADDVDGNVEVRE